MSEPNSLHPPGTCHPICNDCVSRLILLQRQRTQQARKSIEVGQVWVMKVSNRLTKVKITDLTIGRGRNNRVLWRAHGLNIETGRPVMIKSIQKLRRLVS